MELNSNKYIINWKLNWNKMNNKTIIKLKLKSVLYSTLDALALFRKSILWFIVNKSIVKVKSIILKSTHETETTSKSNLSPAITELL